jgi:hypothetical protein
LATNLESLELAEVVRNSHMKFTIEIVPGKSIGPFRLGMTWPEIEEALRSISTDTPLTLDVLGIVAWTSDGRGGWKMPEASERCEQLGIRVYNNEHPILLIGQLVNNISNENAIRLFESFAGTMVHSYGGFDAAQAGIDAVRWENSDPWIDSIFVMPAKTRST